MEDGFLATHDQRVTCVVAALETNNNVSITSEKIDDFTFAFVSPLRPDDRDVSHSLLRAWTWDFRIGF